MDDDEKRIARIFGSREIPDVTAANLRKYRDYLLKHLDKNCILTGREPFDWEERFIFGSGKPGEYERLRKNQPSSQDQYRLIDILISDEDDNDLLATVVRLSDQKTFKMGLSWLEVMDDEAKSFELLDDFATWVANW